MEEPVDGQVVSLKTSDSLISILTVAKNEVKGDVEQSRVEWEEGFKSSGELNSVEPITIDGNKGYKIIGTSIDSEGFKHQNEVIVFVKDGIEYYLLITSGNLQGIQSDIDFIVNSFKVE